MQSELTFCYRCRDGSGRQRSGKLRAGSSEQAGLRLKYRGWRILELVPESNRRQVDLQPQAEPPLQLSSAQLTGFCLQLSTLLESGLPLLRALDTLAASPEAPVADLSERLASRLENGQSLSQALRNWPNLFAPGYLAAVAVGEKTGGLLAVLRRLAEARQTEEGRRARLAAALSYPAFLALSCLFMVVFLATTLLPQLLKLIPPGVEPPLPTRVVLALSQLPWIPLSVSLVCLLAGTWVHLRSPQGESARHRLLYGAFPWASHFRQMLWVELARLLELLLASGVPAAQVLPCLYAPGGPTLRDHLRRAQQRFCEGEHLSVALEGAPPLLLSLLEVSETAGRTERFLQMFISLREVELEGQRETALALLEPLMLVTLGGVVGFVVMAAFLPAYQLVLTP